MDAPAIEVDSTDTAVELPSAGRDASLANSAPRRFSHDTRHRPQNPNRLGMQAARSPCPGWVSPPSGATCAISGTCLTRLASASLPSVPETRSSPSGPASRRDPAHAWNW